jgi:hypothetical protein
MTGSGGDRLNVTRTGDGEPLAFEVVVRESGTESRHHVTMDRETCKRLTAECYTPEHCVEAVFEFLLEREPKESILTRFNVSVVSHYFPEFEQELPHYLARSQLQP